MSIFFLLLLLLLLLSLSISLTSSLNDEGLALLSFKSATTADPRRSLADWNSSDPTPCSWSGVTCDRSLKVVAFSLPRASLSAPLPPTLLTFLPNLRHLNLRSNRLHGPLPSLPFPPSLQSLLLSSNSLSGPIPKSLSNLSSLHVLDLSQNTLSGPIPQTLTQCRRLKTLDLSRNSLSGPLPAEFGAPLAQLERLDLSHNKLTGPIPEDVGKLSNLEGTADFSHNLFSGSIPSSLGQLPEKVYIDLSYNNLSGPIPQTGALENRGPTAFIGNPGLCGPPLKTPCPFSPPNSPPSGSHGSESPSNGGGLGRGALVGIIVSDVIGIALIALLFFYCYQKAITSRDKSLKETKGTKECLCFTKEESQTFSENVEHVELVTLDKGVSFDLDELLKASAFVLGKSGIGIVYKVVLDDGLTLAVRRLGEGGSQRFKEFKMEVEAIGRVRHPNIVSLRAYYWSVEEKLLIYDYIPNGNLSVALHGRSGALPFQPLSWDLRQKIMKGIARGLTHLHEFSPKKYVHGDIKPNNVLLGLKMEPYISDFGLGRLANIAAGPSLPQSNRIGTENSHLERTSSPAVNFKLCYQAPEALKALKPSQKWDVYSYGVILLELISGRSPAVLMETSKMDLVRWIQLCIEEKKPLLDVLDPFLSNELDVREDDIIAVLKIALACVQANPERRPSMRSVVETLERLSVS